MPEREWQLSLDAENDQKMQLLSRLTSQVVRANSETIPAQLFESHYAYEDEDILDMVDEYLSGEFYASLTAEQKEYVSRAISLPADRTWRYGNKLYTDGLWDAEGAAFVHPLQSQDTLILTGLAGADLFGLSKRLDRLAAGIEPDVLKRAVLLGGVALASPHMRYSQPGVAYRGEAQDEMVPETYIGGTHHGDFWTSRGVRFEHDALSPIGEPSTFAPAVEKVHIPGYHGTETGVMRALLAYRAGYQGADRLEVFQKIAGYLQEQPTKGAGNFADFGDDDGFRDASVLGDVLEGEIKENDVLLNTLVTPDNHDLRLQLAVRKEGVEFAFMSDMGETIRSFVLPSNEIEMYAAQLIGSGYGRTSQWALVNIVKVLRDGKPARRSDGYDIDE